MAASSDLPRKQCAQLISGFNLRYDQRVILARIKVMFL
jgi:hypothetical protein